MRSKVLTKDKLISVALDLIKEEGIESCTSRNIAKRANCALGTIYNYFESREVFLEEIFIYSWNETQVKLEQVLNMNLTLEQRVLSMFQIVTEDVKNRNGLGKLLFGTLKYDPTSNNSANKVLNCGNKILIQLLKESDKNATLNEQELLVSAKWIHFGLIALCHQDEETNAFYKVIIDKFF